MPFNPNSSDSSLSATLSSITEDVNFQAPSKNSINYEDKRDHSRQEKADGIKLETEIIASTVFCDGSGVSNSEIDKALRMHISSKNMKDKQRIEAIETVIERLKHKLSMLQDTKNEFIHRICRLEQSLQMDVVHTKAKQQLMRMEISEDDETERKSIDATITNIEELEIQVDENVRSLELLKFSNERLQNEVIELKEKLTSKQRNIAETMIEMKTREE